MSQISLYPLRLEPIFQYRLWGGRRLNNLLSETMPDGPIGEAWLLSDRDDHPTLVADGPLKGNTISSLMMSHPKELLGNLTGRFDRFPLLLKFLDATEVLSVQVHPSDEATEYLPPGESGKTEAWIVLETGSKSRIYAGLKPGTTQIDLEESIELGSVADHLSSFVPTTGDAILLPAGTVHTLCDLVVFEVQENSDVTFRLSDWNRVDPKTEKPRELQVDEAMACIDYHQVALTPATPSIEQASPILRERVFDDEHFGLWRVQTNQPVTIFLVDAPRVLVCLNGSGDLTHDGNEYRFARGDVFLLPAVVGECLCKPHENIEFLEICLPGVLTL
jgi:mannose-6-phosphate isomerase